MGQKIGDRLPRERYRGSVGWLAFGVWLRGTVPALPGRLWGEVLLSRCARGGGVFAFNARSGTVPLPLGIFGDMVSLGTGCSCSLVLVRDRLRRAGDRLLGSVELIDGTGCWGLQ